MSLLNTLRTTVKKNRRQLPESPASVEPETVYEMLRNHRRRCVLDYLSTHEEPIAVGKIADHLADQNGEDRTSIYVTLIQSHLPRMQNAGICEYQSNRKRIELTPQGRTVVEVHRAVSKILD